MKLIQIYILCSMIYIIYTNTFICRHSDRTCIIGKQLLTDESKTLTIKLHGKEYKYIIDLELYKNYIYFKYSHIIKNIDGKLIINCTHPNILFHTLNENIIYKYKTKFEYSELTYDEKEIIYQECLLPFDLNIFEYSKSIYLIININDTNYYPKINFINLNNLNLNLEYLFCTIDNQCIGIPYISFNTYNLYNKLEMKLSTQQKDLNNIISKEMIQINPPINIEIGYIEEYIFGSAYNHIKSIYKISTMILTLSIPLCTNESTVTCENMIKIITIPIFSIIILLIILKILINIIRK